MGETPNYYFICNPAANSGRMKKNWDKIHEAIDEHFDKEQYHVEFTEAPLHAIKLVQDAVDRQFSSVISVGGDGVANEVCNGIMRYGNGNKISMGILPAGTSNDAHLTHKLGNDTIGALEYIDAHKTAKFGVGKATGDFSEEPYFFLDHCDTGLAALAARSAKYGTSLFKGEWKYTLYALKNILKFKSNPGTVTVDGQEYVGDFAVVAAGMGEDMSGYKLWPDNDITKGDFGLLMARGLSRFGLLKLMLAAENGNHIGKEGVDYIRGKKIEIELDRPWPYQAEGEIFAEDSTKVTFEFIPDAIEMITNIDLDN